MKQTSTKLNRALMTISVLGSLCSITGVTVLGILGAKMSASLPPRFSIMIWFAVVLLFAFMFGTLALSNRLSKTISLYEGKIVSPKDRSTLSRQFATGTLRKLRIFAGDLSWLEDDLGVYRELRSRGVQIQILTDKPSATAIAVGKAHGIEFHCYPQSLSAPLKASISDGDEEGESRALIVKRRTPRPASNGHAYSYWMREYHGSIEFPVIKSMVLLFDHYWNIGTPL